MDKQEQSLLEYAKSKGYEIVSILEDVMSRLNENKKSLNKLFDIVERRKIGVYRSFQKRVD